MFSVPTLDEAMLDEEPEFAREAVLVRRSPGDRGHRTGRSHLEGFRLVDPEPLAAASLFAVLNAVANSRLDVKLGVED